MRAARLVDWRAPLELVELPSPEPAPDGVVLKVLACGVCRSDWHAWTGADPVDLPHVPGHEYCGEVIAVGSRIVDYPTRLSNTLPMYGQEIFVRIQPNNEFLNGERVRVIID